MQSKLKLGKSEVRSDLLQKLNQISREQRLEWSRLIQMRLAQALQGQKGLWGAYRPLKDEPQIRWESLSENIQWCYPQVLKTHLQFHTDVTSYQNSPLGVQEPVDGKPIAVADLAGVVVPGLGFSKAGHRIGRGKGFYDRTLKSFKGKKIAVCFGLSLFEELPNEPHDVLFNHIVTESSIYQVNDPEGDLKWN